MSCAPFARPATRSTIPDINKSWNGAGDGRLFLPFDLISRTIMIACCNPFDAAGHAAVQQSLDYSVSWYLARPGSLIKTLENVYRLESRVP